MESELRGGLGDRLVVRGLGLRKLRKLLRRTCLFVATETTTLYPEGLYRYKRLPQANHLKQLRAYLEKALGDKFLILNEIDEDNAYALYEKYEGYVQYTFVG